MMKKEKTSSIQRCTPLRNIDRVKEWLAKAHPDEKDRIASSDAVRIMNCWMQNDKNKEAVAAGLGLAAGKCGMCARGGIGCPDGAMMRYGCRKGILEWLEKES